MSQQLINLSPDLKRLRDEGYAVEVFLGYLLVKDVPYLNSKKEVKLGVLVSELTTAGDRTAAPSTHVIMFTGDYPCDKDGSELGSIRHGGGQKLAENLVVDHSFSSKPKDGYKDYYEKILAYISILLSQAQAIDPEVTAQTFRPIETVENESVFNYEDTASSRAGIRLATRKLELSKVAIIGIGGTGSYILDLVSKTPVKEIHLFDGDEFLSHNAFRAPGAASLEKLRAKPKKVAYLKNIYSKMHRGIIDHDYHINSSNAQEMKGMDFVFLSIDAGESKKAIVESLEKFGIPFVDVGMGVELVDDSLRGILRATCNTPEKRNHFNDRVSLSDPGFSDDYDRNIQVADLNALNAALAVIKWKKHFGFYLDFEQEHHSTYTIDSGMLINDDKK